MEINLLARRPTMMPAMSTISSPGLPGRPDSAIYAKAVRAPFLLVTVGAGLVGLATAWRDGVAIDPLVAAAALLLASIAHAAANVLNDYYDSVSGNDAANTERLWPFTGGSRMIQDGLLTERQTLRFGIALVAATLAGGLALLAVAGPGLLAFGIAGLFAGVAYSMPPVALNARGWGEVSICAAWMIVVSGMDYVVRGHFDASPWFAGFGYALLVTNVLFINQFPDRRADEAAGKRHWVVRLGADRASRVYLLLVVAAHAALAAAVLAGALPLGALAGLVSLAPALGAAALLRAHRHEVARLVPAIRLTIAAALLHALALSAGIAFPA